MAKFSLKNILSVGIVALMVTGCTHFDKPEGENYWQRIEAHSALYLTGPKAQQSLEQNIATCVREIDELVELNALRETMPPATHNDYHDALDRNRKLEHWDSPSRLGDHMADHSDFHDFESCMRSKGWERVKYVRYQQADSAQKTYEHTQQIRKYGVSGEAAKAKEKQIIKAANTDEYNSKNE